MDSCQAIGGEVATASARPTPVGRVDPVRVIAATVAILAAVVGIMWGVRVVEPAGRLGAVLAFLAGVVLVPFVASPIEWFVHRFVYHEAVIRRLDAIFVVHSAHHFAYFPTRRYVTSGPARRLALRRRAPDVHLAPARNALVRLAHFCWYLSFGLVLVWLPAWFITRNSAFVLGLVVASMLVSNLFIVVHDTIHRPSSHPLVEAQPWFAFLDRHHYIHHVDLGANLNFLLPLADLLFGTLRTAMTPDEIRRHGTLDRAKRRPVGFGERATTHALTAETATS